MKISNRFADAREDYLYLLNRGYPTKSALDVVGNHYQLSKDERMLLFRGIRNTHAVVMMEHRLLELPTHANQSIAVAATDTAILHQPGLCLILDGYNVLGTILSYLLGRMLFISNDGMVRDIGAFHGKFSRNTSLLENAINALAKTCKVFFEGLSYKVYLDEPVSESAQHKLLFVTVFQKQGISIDAEIIHSADYGLLTAEQGILCTSDSAIIDATEQLILDLPRIVIEHEFNATIQHINNL